KVDIQGYFQPGSSIRVADEIINRNFGGSMMLQMLVKGDIQDPAVLEQMKEMQEFLKKQSDIHNPQSVLDLIIEMNDVIGEGRRVPDSREKVANLWFFLEGQEVMSQLVNEDKNEAVIQCMVSRIDTASQLKKMLDAVRDHIRERNNDKISYSLTGYPSIYEHLDNSIIRSQVRSLIICVILVFICLVLLLRSFTGGLIGLVPITFTLLLIFGCMGYFHIPLDVATVLVGSIAIGIGIDYPIHFISRFRQEFHKSKSAADALDITLRTTGKAITINVLTVMLGFLVLLFGNLVPIQNFSILLAITMLGSGISTMVLLPALIIVTKAGFVGTWIKGSDKVE
ncbi:MAG: efflux RND transporter permease subunit, partial [bacterium]|nr:efflux RND transporter permease subunit [bacterium]